LNQLNLPEPNFSLGLHFIGLQEKTPVVDQTPEAQQRRAELRAEAARDLEPWRAIGSDGMMG